MGKKSLKSLDLSQFAETHFHKLLNVYVLQHHRFNLSHSLIDRSNRPPQRLPLRFKLCFNGVLKRTLEIPQINFHCDELCHHNGAFTLALRLPELKTIDNIFLV
jgi:hypothetical protein